MYSALPIRLDINREMAKLLQTVSFVTMNEDESGPVVKQSRLSQLLTTEEQVPQLNATLMYVDLKCPSVDIDPLVSVHLLRFIFVYFRLFSNLRYNITFSFIFKPLRMVEYGG